METKPVNVKKKRACFGLPQENWAGSRLFPLVFTRAEQRGSDFRYVDAM
jgi:hypothetical protein